MNLAIILLVAVGLASVIGTVLQQNQPYQDYQVKFGTFWFRIFETLGLYDVYTAGWFVFMLAFLITATSVCLTRHTPTVLREMRQYRANRQVSSLRAMRNHREWTAAGPVSELSAVILPVLRHYGYRVRSKPHGGALLLAGLAGRANRMGYIFTHLAVVMIAIGGLMDGSLVMKFQSWTGQVQPETANLPLSEIPSKSRVKAGQGAFRGSITIPEDDRTNVVFLPLREGYVVRDLPFQIQLEEFRIEHYASGQPRSYESDVIITGPGIDSPIQQTIKVNHPLTYDGFTIYQASFSDGGTLLRLKAWPVRGVDRNAWAFEGSVFDQQTLKVDGDIHQLEFTDFQLHNIRPNGDAIGKIPSSKNIGPSFRFLIRKPNGETLEFENAMLPLDMDDGRYFLSGVRDSNEKPFKYLHIPADHQDSPALFMAFAEILDGSDQVKEIAHQTSLSLMNELDMQNRSLGLQLEVTALRLVDQLVSGGYAAVEKLLKEGGVTDGQIDSNLQDVSLALLDNVLIHAYRVALGKTGQNPDRILTEKDTTFLNNAVYILPAMERYGAPVFLQLVDFYHRQASGLEITKSPGKPIVYAGFSMLMVGVFLMFFVRYRRAWCWFEPVSNGNTRVLLAGYSERDSLGFSRHFTQVIETLRAIIPEITYKEKMSNDKNHEA